MPLPLIPLAIGAATGGAGVWFVSDATQKLTTLVIVCGLGYYLYKGAK